MAMGGIYDQLGGGFHRYSTDREWKVPHFEKMLYDNGQLVSLYSQAYRLTKNPLYRRVVEETLDFVAREMTAPDGGFYAALDAETDAEEGKYYVWTAAEIEQCLSKADAELYKTVYGLSAGPNFEEKFSVLLLPLALGEAAAGQMLTEEQLLQRLTPLKQKLLAARAARPRPLLDTKVITSWNGLMIAGLAEASIALQQPEYAQRGARAADFVLRHLRTRDGRLLRTWTANAEGAGTGKLNAYLEDYTHFVQGLLRLHEATGNQRWLDEAVALTAAMIAQFGDAQFGGFFFTSHDHEKLFARAKDQYDGAIPCGNSMAAMNLIELAAKTRDGSYLEKAEDTFKAFGEKLREQPSSLTTMVQAFALFQTAKEKKPAAPAQRDDLFDTKEAPKKAEEPVKVSAVVAGQEAKEGKLLQTLAVTMEIAKGWHAYANPAGDDSFIPTTVTVSADKKPEEVKVDYPVGVELKLAGLNDPALVYEGKVTIPVVVRREAADGKTPLQVVVRYQVCDDKRCLAPKTVKLSVVPK
jgi:hypothetical protein